MSRKWRLAAAPPLLLLLGSSLRGEFLSVEMQFGGLDCPSCRDSLESTFRRIRGVEDVQVARDRQVIRLQLKEGNRVRLERLRDALKGLGYTPGEATVEVRGKASGDRLDVSGFEPAYVLKLEPAKQSDNASLWRGVIPYSANPHEPLTLKLFDGR
ncbi:MAG: heavy-metal-associated domain-containing protein [Bryobacteraceae bacterium]|nr:heavy-metal-associated domain-containing protein [Bryobacteraceae bacterium]